MSSGFNSSIRPSTARRGLLVAAASVALLGAATAQAGSIAVYVGYADDLRPTPFFPNPWSGSPNTFFIGAGVNIDAGAIRVDNTGATPVTINSISIDMPWVGLFNYNIWGTPNKVLAPGERLIVTQTSQYNFDTSDFGPTQPLGVPLPDGETTHATHVNLIVDASSLPAFLDTGHVLTTGGFDSAGLLNGQNNESLQWRLIGTTGINDPGGNGNPVPEGNTLFALGSLAFAGVGMVLRRRATA